MINELVLVIGFLLVFGAYRRWRWLVDPPLEWSLFYSQAQMRRLYGKTFTIYATYFIGCVFILGGGMLTYREHRLEILSVICRSCIK